MKVRTAVAGTGLSARLTAVCCGNLGLHDVPVLGGAASILTFNQRVGNTHGLGQRHG